MVPSGTPAICGVQWQSAVMLSLLCLLTLLLPLLLVVSPPVYS